MKNLTLTLLVTVLLFSCKPQEKKEVKPVEKFPTELGKVFEKHGGIDKWRSQATMSFYKGEEQHTIDLWNRKTYVMAPKYSMGYDGNEVWLQEVDSGAYRGNPEFYHNLFFYFYAMPFVLADDGIIYENAEAIEFEGVKYPGIKISYEANIGTSPDDNYILYYHPETFQMEWLAYTVTFRSKAPSDRYNLIKYGQWGETNGLVLPTEITWYQKDENGQPTEPRGPGVAFTKSILSEEQLPPKNYLRPTE